MNNMDNQKEQLRLQWEQIHNTRRSWTNHGVCTKNPDCQQQFRIMGDGIVVAHKVAYPEDVK
jgi:hypothetical protein